MSFRTGRAVYRDPHPPTRRVGPLATVGLIAALTFAFTVVGRAQPRGDDAPPIDAATVRSRAAQAADPVVLPYVPLPADVAFKADRVTAWPVGPERRLLLEGDTEIAIGSYRFQADNAVVFITSVQPARGAGARQIELYLDTVRQIGDGQPIEAEARRLLVTAMVRGKVKLTTDRLIERPAADAPLVEAAEARVQRYYDALRERLAAMDDGEPIYPPHVLERREQMRRAIRQRQLARQPDRPDRPAPPDQPDEPDRPAPPDEPDRPTEPDTPDEPDQPAPPIAPEPPATAEGDDGDAADPDELDAEQRRLLEALRQVHFTAGRIVADGDAGEDWVVLQDKLRIMYRDPVGGRDLTLTADRGAIFLEPGTMADAGTLKANNIRGIYLEDNVVVSSGDYTLRGPRVFYDLQNDRAILLKSVFYAWSVKKQVPLYVRAEKIMQVARDQWRAERATLSTSEFFEPHFAIGVERLTITQDRPTADRGDGEGRGGVEAGDGGEETDGEPTYRYSADDVTLQAGGLPVFYWPGVSGTAGDVPLRRLNVDADSRDGLIIRTEWDLFGLADKQPPDGVDAALLVDGYTERGPALGLDLRYNRPKAYGDLETYLIYDTNKDEPGGREVTDPHRDFRGRAIWRHRHFLEDDWELSAEVGYASDPTFLEEFFPDEAYTDKPWETSVYAKKQTDDRAFTLLLKHDPLDFMPQLGRLQTPGYTVEKLPEASYYTIGTPLLDDRLSWFSETRVGLLSLNFPEQTPRQLGFSPAESLAVFGFMNNRRLDAALNGAGLEEDEVARFDTRHELALPMTVGPVDAVPYVVGRFTAYGDNFERFAGEDENLRVRGQAGLKLHTAFSRTFEDVENKLLDVHRLRHIVEPSAHVNFTWTNVEQDQFPVYDYDVESLTEGGVVRLGLRNTLQTQRGGPGNWRSVDWVRLDTDLVIADGQTALESPLARFFDYRPEFSLAGDHFWSELAWQVTDTLTAVGNINHSFETDDVERWNLGVTLDHNPGLTSFVQVRRINALDSLIARWGFSYLLSAKYHLTFTQTFDLEDDDNRGVTATLTRRLPRMLLMVTASFDEITDTSSIGIAIIPEGASGRGSPEQNPFIFTR